MKGLLSGAIAVSDFTFPWNPHALREQLTELDWLRPEAGLPERDEYRQFYGLPDSSVCSHNIGWNVISGRRIGIQIFRPAEAAGRGSVLLVHGYYDHCALYGHLIHLYLALGLNVVTFDLPGHGLSDGEVAAIGSFDEYLEVLDRVWHGASAALPGPWLWCGQSTGGAIIASWLLRQRLPAGVGAPDRVLLLAPLLRPQGWRAGRWLHTLLRPLVRRLRRRFSMGGNNPEFSRFLAIEDPLQSRYLSVSWVTAMKQWLVWIERCEALDFPVLLIQGDADQTVDWHYNLPVYQRLFPALVLERVAGGHHHLANETAGRWQTIVTSVRQWCALL